MHASKCTNSSSTSEERALIQSPEQSNQIIVKCAFFQSSSDWVSRLKLLNCITGSRLSRYAAAVICLWCVAVHHVSRYTLLLLTVLCVFLVQEKINNNDVIYKCFHFLSSSSRRLTSHVGLQLSASTERSSSDAKFHWSISSDDESNEPTGQQQQRASELIVHENDDADEQCRCGDRSAEKDEKSKSRRWVWRDWRSHGPLWKMAICHDNSPLIISSAKHVSHFFANISSECVEQMWNKSNFLNLSQNFYLGRRQRFLV